MGFNQEYLNSWRHTGPQDCPAEVAQKQFDKGDARVLAMFPEEGWSHVGDIADGGGYCSGEDLVAIRVDADTVIQRPNHCLSHALRQTCYLPFVFAYAKACHLLKADTKFDTAELLKLQLKLIFYTTGRPCSHFRPCSLE